MFDPDKFLAGDAAAAPKPPAFDPDAFLSGAPTPAPPGTIDQEMDWSAKFNGVDYAKNRMSEQDKAGFDRLAEVTDNSADAQKQAISMAYVQKLLPDIGLPVLQKNWPAVRQAFASSVLGLKDGEVDDGKLYEAINESVNGNLQQLWATAHPDERLKMIFGSEGYGDHEVKGGGPIIGSESAGTKGVLFTIPKMEGNNSFAGLINATNRVTSGLTTPESLGIMIATGGLGALADLANATRVAVVSRAAQAAVIGTVTLSGAKDTKEAYAKAKLVLADPHATDAEKTDAIASVVFKGSLTAAAAKGTYDLGMDAKAEAGKQGKAEATEGKAADMKKLEADNAKKVEAANLLRDSANQSPPEVAQILTEAAHQTHPYATNGAQITETDSGFVITDAIGNHVDTVKTVEEARAVADKANGVKEAPSGKDIAAAKLEADNATIRAKLTEIEGKSPDAAAEPATAKDTAAAKLEADNATQPHADNGAQITEPPQEKVQSSLTPEAVDMLDKIDKRGAAPAFISKNLERIANDNGVEVTGSMKPQDVVDAIRKKGQPSEDNPEAGETTGTAHRVSEARGVAAERGEGVSGQDAVEHGREVLASGLDVEKALADFNADPSKNISYDVFAATRARIAQLAKAADDAAEKHGPESPEYKAAKQAEKDMVAAFKPMQTEWNKTGRAQQGETDIDTGTYHGMAKAVRETTKSDTAPEGKEPTPKQVETIKEHVERVKKATEEETKAAKEVAKRGKEATSKGESKPPTRKSSLDYLSEKAAAARERIKAFRERPDSPLGKQSGAVINPTELAALARDHAIVGAEYIAKGVTEFGEWSKAMVKEFGDYVKPHLQDLFSRAQKEGQTAEAETPAFIHKAGEKWTPDQAKALWKRGAELIDSGMSFDDMRHSLAKEFSLPVEDVTNGLASPKGMREITDEMYSKMAARRAAITKAKIWVTDQKYPGWQKAFREVPHFFFNLVTFGHGTAWFTTHASSQIFIPKATGAIITELGRAFRMMGVHEAEIFGGSGMGAYHERMMQDLVRDPNFIRARRAGLSNDPFHYTDDYQSASVVKQFKALGLIGNRGFDGLKLLRQFRFNQEWEALPDNLKTPEMAKIIADAQNKATGHVDVSRLPKLIKAPFFAPGLEASKWAMLFKDPVMDAKTLLLDRKNATPEQIRGAQTAMKTSLQLVGTYLSALTLNQAMLSATNSDQKINFTDPLHGGDWLNFKGFGLKGTPLSPLIRPVMYLMQMSHAFWGERSKYEQSQGSRAGEAYDKTGEYLRSKLHPFWGIAADSVTGSDFRGNTMPWNDDRISRFSTRNGAHQVTASEYLSTHTLPIPMEEAAQEVWSAQGIGQSQQEEWLAALRQAFMAGTTGMRISEDNSTHQDSTQPEWMEKLTGQ